MACYLAGPLFFMWLSCAWLVIRIMRYLLRAFGLCAVTLIPATAQTSRSVLMISIDGMRPDYVTHADEHGLRIPNLRRILAQGAHADGVQGVFPTVTYPSHTTLVTGVWPAQHGILNNQRFDPERKLSDAWFWYEQQIHAPTLWSSAHAAGLSTASVGWPVTAGATDIDYLIPEYWRGPSAGNPVNPDDRLLLNALSRPSGEVLRIAERTGTPYMLGNDISIGGDEIKTVYSLDILKQHRPQFMTIHLSSLDEEEHLHGPFSAEADTDLEALDGMVGRLVAQERVNFPDAVVAVVSDHGFADVQHATNLYAAFVKAGFMDIEGGPADATRVRSWKAEPWLAGGMAAVMLHDSADATTRNSVHTLLMQLAADPESGIEAVLGPEETAQLGGFPEAAFVVTLKAGYVAGAAVSGPLVSETASRGTHGYNPATTPQMRSSFFIEGKGIPSAASLGIVDMRQIAPTLAHLLGAGLPSAQKEPLGGLGFAQGAPTR